MEGKGEREKVREERGDWGKGGGNACRKTPLQFIYAFASERKFLIMIESPLRIEAISHTIKWRATRTCY